MRTRHVFLLAALWAGPVSASADLEFDQGVDAAAALRAAKEQTAPEAPPAVPAPDWKVPSVENSVLIMMSGDGPSFRFTREQYERLRAAGGRLRMSSDSSWVPAAIEQNLLASIDFAFRNGLADELSWRDLFHAHVELSPVDAGPSEIEIVEFNKESDGICGTHNYTGHLIEAAKGNVALQTPEEYSRRYRGEGACSARSTEKLYREQLRRLAANPRHRLRYHTRETSLMLADPAEKNRTIMTAADALPRRLAEPQGESVQSALSQNINFFVTTDGEIVVQAAPIPLGTTRMWMRLNGVEPSF